MKKVATVLFVITLIFFCFNMVAYGADSLSVLLYWNKDVEMAGFLVAENDGLYKKYGIDVELIGRDAIKKHVVDEMLEGKADIGMTSGMTYLMKLSKNYEFKAFASMLQNSPAVLVSLKKNKILNAKSLKGRTIGYRFNSNILVIRLMLLHNGMDLKDVKLKKVDSLYDALLSGEVDSIEHFEFNEPLTLKMNNIEMDMIYAIDNGFPFYGSLLIARPDFIEKNRERLTRFLVATMEGWDLFFSDISKYTRVIVDHYYPKDSYIKGSKDLTYQHQILMAQMMKHWMQYNVLQKSMGLMTEDKWKASCDVMTKHGIISEKIDLGRVYTNEVVLSAIDRKKKK